MNRSAGASNRQRDRHGVRPPARCSCRPAPRHFWTTLEREAALPVPWPGGHERNGLRYGLGSPARSDSSPWPVIDLSAPDGCESSGHLRTKRGRVHVSVAMAGLLQRLAGRPRYLAGQLYGLRSRLHQSGGKNSATSRKPVRPESVTHLAGTFRYPCVRVGP